MPNSVRVKVQSIQALIQGQLPVTYSCWQLEGTADDGAMTVYEYATLYPNPQGLAYMGFTAQPDPAFTRELVRERIGNLELRPEIVERQMAQAAAFAKADQSVLLANSVLLMQQATNAGIPLAFLCFARKPTGEIVTLLWHPPEMLSADALKLLKDGVTWARSQSRPHPN